MSVDIFRKRLVSSGADLGTRLIVRLDGKGDFTSIQAAIDAAKPNSLIEIQDNGPYGEPVAIPNTKPGLTLRGAAGMWPVLTSSGGLSDFPVLLRIEGSGCTAERLVLLHIKPEGENQACVDLAGVRNQMHCCLAYCFGGLAFRYSLPGGEAAPDLLENCLLLGGVRLQTGRSTVVNCIIPSGALCDCSMDFQDCTIPAGLRIDFPSAVADSVIVALTTREVRSYLLANCLVGRPPDNRVVKMDHSIVTHPLFRDPANLDYRLVPGSPGTGAASDGGDMGVRYTPEMVELCKIALELRAKGVIKF